MRFAFWTAWSFGPGLFFVLLVTTPSLRPWSIATILLLTAFAASLLTTVGLGLVRGGPRRDTEYRLLVLFWLGFGALFGLRRLDPFDVVLPVVAFLFFVGAAIPLVTFTRSVRDRARARHTN